MNVFPFTRRARVTFGACALAVSLTACGSGSDSKQAVEAATPTTAASPALTSDSALEAALIKNVPVGFVQVPDEEAETGPTTKDEAAKADDAQGGRELLAKSDYINGYQRVWSKGEDAMLAVAIYVFGAQADAAEYNTHNQSVFDGEPDANTAFVEGVPNSKMLHKQSSDGEVFVTSFQHGAYVVNLLLGGNGVDAATATSLALQQLHNLS